MACRLACRLAVATFAVNAVGAFVSQRHISRWTHSHAASTPTSSARGEAVMAEADDTSSRVVEFDMETTAAPAVALGAPADGFEEKNIILYCLGLNLAKQLPADLGELLSPSELETTMVGLADAMLGKCEDPAATLAAHGPALNAFVEARAAAFQEKLNARGREILVAAKQEEGATTTKGGVVVIPIGPRGHGMFPTEASSVKVHYVGRLAGGEPGSERAVFDSSVARGEPATFALKQVIRGWQEGLQEMQEGGKAKLVVPSDLGYGPAGQPQAGIPGGAVLEFEVELIKVLSGGVGGLVL